MIDTVCLLIPKAKIKNVADDISGAQPWSLNASTEQYERFVKNPNKKQKNSGLYYPRLTGYNRKLFDRDNAVRIEFSVPKLVFNNNLDELTDDDFDVVIDTLHSRLMGMGVLVLKSDLITANVSSVHYSKNIRLQNGYTACHIISELNKVNLRMSFDFAKARFINDGQSWYAHTDSHELVIYDKIADLKKSKKRSIDKDQTDYQLSLFPNLSRDKLLEVIRFEARLNRKQKMIKVLGIGKSPKFRDVFSMDISKRVVTRYWRELIVDKNLSLLSVECGVKDLLRKIYLSDQSIKAKQAVYLAGLFALSKDDNGMRELRSILSKNCAERSWYRLAKDLEGLGVLLSSNGLRDWVKLIDKAMDEYLPYRIEKSSHSS